MAEHGHPMGLSDGVQSGLQRLGLHPELWAAWSPNGMAHQKPRHFKDMFRIALRQAPEAAYTLKVLTQGVCDGCALGVAGLKDWTLDGPHLCTTRLELLEFNTMGAFAPSRLSDLSRFDGWSGKQLREMGRLGFPMRRRRGEPGFRRITWTEALDAVAGAICSTTPDRVGMYLTSRGLTNETYYAAGKAARAMGVANIDSAARVCHSPSTVGLRATVGVAASTCSLQDVIESDLVVLWGTNPANNQPVFMKYLEQAKRRGARVVVVNPYLEPGLERYWIPSRAESALFGTTICDLHVPVRPGGDIAFANAVVAELAARGAFDEQFVADHTEGWDDLVARLDDQDPDARLQSAGVDRATLDEFCDLYAAAGSAVLVWSMGITQHTFGAEAVQGIVNVALARGNVGRDGAGLMPIRGHSGVQGGAEMGAYATSYPGNVPVDADSAAALGLQWGFEVPAEPGLTAPELVEAAADGQVDVLWASGGNFLDVLPDPDGVRAALGRVPLRVHADLVVTSQMLVEGDDVILLPVRTRYEQEGGGTSTTTERRIAFSPEVPRQVGEARSEWRLYGDLATRVRPDRSAAFRWPDNQALRAEIARVVPDYAGIETLERTGDAVQYGGRHLCRDGVFPTPTGRGRFTPLDLPVRTVPEGKFLVTTRRGKQFNSIVWSATDPLTGAPRDAVYLDPADAARLGLADGDPVLLRSAAGEMHGHVHLARLPLGTAQVHFPEGNPLLPSGATEREPRSKIPAYQAVVEIVGTLGP